MASSIFNILQWNILANGLAQPAEFWKVAEDILSWESRRERIVGTVRSSKAEICCFQELNHYDDFFKLAMGSLGYKGIFHPKRKSPSVEFGCPPDGCAFFYKEDRFELSESSKFNYRRDDGEEMNQGAVLASFLDKVTGHKFYLAVTHLKAKSGEENARIRKVQAHQLLNQIDKFRGSEDVPWVVVGDFNSEPQMECWEAFQNHSLGFQCVYNRVSPCVKVHEQGKECSFAGLPEIKNSAFSTWKFRPAGEKCVWIDYIWYSTSTSSPLLLTGHWCVPRKDEIGPSGLPSETFPSDHLPLLAQFNWL